VSTDAGSEYPAFIDPKDEDVEGIVTGFSEGATKFGSAVIVNLKVGDTERSLWLTQTVLKSQFARLKPKVGERVKVEYLGQRDGASGEYHNYRVTAPDRPPFVPDWSQLAGEDYADENPFEPEEAS
jgi:hypothetical protein